MASSLLYSIAPDLSVALPGRNFNVKTNLYVKSNMLLNIC